MSSTIPTENISFSDIQTAYNNSEQGVIPNPGLIKLSDISGATLQGVLVPTTNISIAEYLKGKTFGWPPWTERFPSCWVNHQILERYCFFNRWSEIRRRV